MAQAHFKQTRDVISRQTQKYREIAQETGWTFKRWNEPSPAIPMSAFERDAVKVLTDALIALPTRAELEAGADAGGHLVKLPPLPIPDGVLAFLENDREPIATPLDKPSFDNKDGAYTQKNWRVRVGSWDDLQDRLKKGFAVSTAVCDRYGQMIRKGELWYGAYGILGDGDEWNDGTDEKAKYPEPCYSLDELLERYPLLREYARFILPSPRSLYEGRPFKCRIGFDFGEMITDKAVFDAIGTHLFGHFPFLPIGVTHNPIAVAFGAAHNADQMWVNPEGKIPGDVRALAKSQAVIERNARHVARKKAEERRETYAIRKRSGDVSETEPISTFIKEVDAVAEMERLGWLTQNTGHEYHWHASESRRSCEIENGVLKVFSGTMADVSPVGAEPVNAHRFLLYNLYELDITKDSDKPDLREKLAAAGYGKIRTARRQRKTKWEKRENTAGTSLEQADTKRKGAVDAFLTDTGPDELHILLLKEWTGTGKTHTLLTKAREHGKRTLAQLPHSDLAAQAVQTALKAGFTSPKHLLGREHNWDASEIEKIPIEERTDALFEKNNCIRVEDIRRFREHNLPERSFCEMSCPFREACTKRGHLAQYVGIEERDFIASANPSLLFDIRSHGYLKSIVNTRREPTDEELAIDAALGTHSEPIEPFDFAILDDYTVSSLYSDVVLSESRWKAVKKAWKGTPTADFAKGVRKAFGKQKPHKIVKALRSAIATSKPHFEEIATALTQHARHGVIEWSAKTKGSQDTRNLLSEKQVSYTDGGVQFIPVSLKAYAELSQKGIPTVHPDRVKDKQVGESVLIPHAPTHALRAGVSLTDLTPVWHRGATPIEMITRFLETIGNDKNAPITRFRTDDTATLHFSVPPHAPLGILPKLALLSATTDTDAVKQAFDGQPVGFSEHIGTRLKWADGAEVYQYEEARLTSASVFEYERDAAGKRNLQKAPIGVTEKAQLRIGKLNDWAKQIDGMTAFISYKEFTTEPFLPFVDGFDIVTHFDKVAGLNVDGLKYLVVFGYPKVKHEVVMEHARKQYASDTDPLPKGSYEELTAVAEITENGVTAVERRYVDPRLDTIRHQLATEKLEQAIGRARLPRWKDTTTLLFTNAPVAVTPFAHPFTDCELNLVEHPREIPNATQRIATAVENGDVNAVMQAADVSRSTAQRKTKNTREQKKADRTGEVGRLHQEGKSQRDISAVTGIPRSTVARLIKVAHFNQSQLGTLIRDDYFGPPHEKVDSTRGSGEIPPVTDGSVVNRSLTLFQKRHGQLSPLIGNGENGTVGTDVDSTRGSGEIPPVTDGSVEPARKEPIPLVAAERINTDGASFTDPGLKIRDVSESDMTEVETEPIANSHPRRAKPTPHGQLPTPPPLDVADFRKKAASVHRKSAQHKRVHSFFTDRKMHTSREIAEKTRIPEAGVDAILDDWYEKVMLRPGIGHSYWMTETDSQNCKEYIEKERDTGLRHILDEY